MRKHPVRKFFGLFVLYSVVIIGIFVLQFKTESVISETIGTLKISLAQSESESSAALLKNQLAVNFRGFNFTANETIPAYAVKNDGTKENLVLKSWSKPADLSARFDFTNGAAFIFAVSGTDKDDQLSINAVIPQGYSEMGLSYRTAGSYKIDSQTGNRLFVSDKNKKYAFNVPELTEDNYMIFTQRNNLASYSVYDASKRFAYEAVAGIENADYIKYLNSIKEFRSIAASKLGARIASADPETLTEAEIIAYIAELASINQYNEALNAIPEGFKKSNKRTYLSSPFLDNLVNMNRTLVMQTERFDSQADSALSTKNLDIFTVDGIADYLVREKYRERTKQILNICSAHGKFEPTLYQAQGILSVYTGLFANAQELAHILDPYLDVCLDTIASCVTLDNSTISIKYNDQIVPAESLIRIGQTLVDFGNLVSRPELTQTGCLMVNCALANAESFDTALIATAYPVLVDNVYYPHTTILGWYGKKAVWAWTSAQSISYEIQDDAVIDITIDFPQNLTHYVIFNGIPTFHHKIEIQKNMFRTDPRFETYNSSGYVYQTPTETLFIKSRHKSQNELIRLFCDTATFTDIYGNTKTYYKPVPKPVVEQVAPAETPAAQEGENPIPAPSAIPDATPAE